MGPVIEVIDVHKQYNNGIVANKKINLCINEGEIFGIFGPNGAGKTTLIKQITTLIRPTSGRIKLLNRFIDQYPAVAVNNIAYLGQTASAFNAYRFDEIILHAGILRGLNKNEAIKQTDYLINRFKLDSKRKRLRYQLSGGERKMSMILATFIGYKPILILDEPTNELDPAYRAMVWEYLLEHNEVNNTTIILVTHNVLEAENVVNRVAIIDQGEVCALGTLGELKSQISDEVKIIATLKKEVCLSKLKYSIKKIQKNKYSILSNTRDMPNVFDSMVDHIGLHNIDDFRISTPTLEDVYTKLTRRDWHD